MTPARLDWLYVGGALLVAAGAEFLLQRFWRRNPEQAERRRRERVNRIGRIAQCEILDIVERDAESPPRGIRAWFASSIAPAAGPNREFVVYRYMISGVTYETAQDVAGLPTSVRAPAPGRISTVKYDPANPSNSILLTESWAVSGEQEAKVTAPGKGQ